MIALGNSATMPAMMISDVPLPTPRAVICSPSHIRNMVPPTSVVTVDMVKNRPGSSTMATPPPRAGPCRARAIPSAWAVASTTVR